MISDGYNRKVILPDGDRSIVVVYRPATRTEWESFKDIVSLLDDRFAHVEICRWIAKHIVASELSLTKDEPLWESVWDLSRANEAAFDRLFNAIIGIVPDGNGRTWAEQESEHQWNLRVGSKLERDNPRLARRSCEDCLKYWYSETSGLPILEANGEKMLRVGDTCCRTEIGCKKGTPEKQRSLSPMNRMAYRHYLECCASSFPDDPIVRQNALIIKTALESK